MGNIQVSGPNEATIISGSWCSGQSTRYIVADWGWRWKLVSEVNTLSLNVMTLEPVCHSVETKKGVPLTVTGCAQVRVMYDERNDKKTNKEMLIRACQNFVGLSEKQFKDILTSTMEGHLRAIIGSMTVEQVYQDRDELADLVEDTATPDLGRMGIQILSFVLKDVRDDVEYITTIGNSIAAQTKCEAEIGDVNADRDAAIVETQCAMEVTEVTAKSAIEIDNARKEFKLIEEQCRTKINTERAEAKLAYDIEYAIQEQTIRTQEIEVDIIRKRKEIEVQTAEFERCCRELEAKERRPVEFGAKKIELVARGHYASDTMIAQAEADKMRIIGEAQANATRVIGEAEARALKMRAEAMQDFGRAAIVNMVLESLPQLASQMCEPLQDVEELVMVGGTGSKIQVLETTPLMGGGGKKVGHRDADISVLTNRLKGFNMNDALAGKF